MPRPSSSQTSTPPACFSCRCPDEPLFASELCRTPHPCLLEPKHLVPLLAKLLCQLKSASGHTHTSFFSWVQRRDIRRTQFQPDDLSIAFSPVLLCLHRLGPDIPVQNATPVQNRVQIKLLHLWFPGHPLMHTLQKLVHQGRASSHALTVQFRQNVRALVAWLSCMAANVEGLNTRQPS